jgi:hypothetical protein
MVVVCVHMGGEGILELNLNVTHLDVLALA